MEPREDDYVNRLQGIANLSDEELHDLFWELAFTIVEPLIDLARKHTSPSIERSVLLRMGVSSLDSQAIVKGCMERGILGKGAGHVIWRVARNKGIDIKTAAEGLATGRYWDYVEAVFGTGPGMTADVSLGVPLGLSAEALEQRSIDHTGDCGIQRADLTNS